MTDPVLPPFRVTYAAIEQLVQLGGKMRIDVEAGGCCGNTYVFTLDPGMPDDAAYGCPGAELFVSQAADPVLPGATIDFSSRVKPPRFRIIKNPNTPQRCPCNRSFGRVWPGKGQPECRAKAAMPWDR